MRTARFSGRLFEGGVYPGRCLPGGCLPGGCLSHPPFCGQTDACENITLPQTSFAGGNEAKHQVKFKASMNLLNHSSSASQINSHAVLQLRFTIVVM